MKAGARSLSYQRKCFWEVIDALKQKGAQAIAAMSYGTESIPKVDKIFGPGNQYVTAAKQMVFLDGTAIDMPAEPSEVMVVVDEMSNPEYAAADLLSQAEHGADSQVVLVSSDEKTAEKTRSFLLKQLDQLPKKKLDTVISNLKQPVLGICLGLQLMCEFSEENNTTCLKLLPAKVKRFDINLKIPHVGWNQIYGLRGPLFEGVEEGSYVYFVHGYYAEANPYTIAETTYGNRFSSAIKFNNFIATQFHPERSGKTGEQILKNFLAL